MSDWDELLGEILREDMNPEPEPGLEQRVLAAVCMEKSQGRDWVRVWMGVAAAVLVGLGTWMFGLARVGHRARAPVERASLKFSREGSAADTRKEAALFDLHPIPSVRGPVPKVEGVVHQHHPAGDGVLKVAPLEIQPLVVESIEVAAIVQDSSIRKGKIL